MVAMSEHKQLVSKLASVPEPEMGSTTLKPGSGRRRTGCWQIGLLSGRMGSEEWSSGMQRGRTQQQLECVMRLVEMGCEVNRVTSRFNQTPTHTAAFGGHPHCVVWLTQAGADVNKQDFVVSAAGKLASLKNASGQTAADLAHAQGFHDCFCFISNAQKHLHQRNVPEGNIVQNGGSAPCGLGALSRKRQLAALDAGHLKKAKRADGMLVQSSALEELEAMSLELSVDFNNGHLHTAPHPPLSPNSHSPPRCRRASAEMCGSLHLSSSPGGCVSNWPACLGPTGVDCGDFLHYGHYHGFGDTAEELSDSSCIRAEHPSKQAVDGTIHLYHGS